MESMQGLQSFGGSGFWVCSKIRLGSFVVMMISDAGDRIVFILSTDDVT